MIKFISTLLVVLMLSGNVVYGQELGELRCRTQQQRDSETLDNVYINVEFALTIEDFKQHPYFVNAFTAAVKEWARHIPIRTTFYFDGLEAPWLVLGPSATKRFGVIKIGLVDLQSDEYRYDDQMIGIWIPSRYQILFDIEFFQRYPERLYSTALHELGHLFGVPHVINKNDLGYTGYLILSEGDASTYVMYPSSSKDNPQDQLSKLEIDYARHQVTYVLAMRHLMLQQECHIAVDD